MELTNRLGKVLLERFVDLYGETPLEGSMIAPGLVLWRDYWKYSGQHMILTDDGWEPADIALPIYAENLDDGEDLSDVIQDEVNWQFGLMKYEPIHILRARKRLAPVASSAEGSDKP
jgi:hypothetical protein